MWHPEKSLVLGMQEDSGCEERGRGSSGAEPEAASRPKTVQIIRQRRPTVDTRGVSNQSYRKKIEGPDQKLQNYATVEQNGNKGEQALLDYDAQFWEGTHSTQQLMGCEDFCGWMEKEPLGNYASGHRVVPGGSSRFGIQTPAEGFRSALQSRVSSRLSGAVSGRRRCHYDFMHFQDAHEYIEHYRNFYCYTTLNVQPTLASRRECRVLVAEDIVENTEENPKNFMPLGVRSLYRGDPYLKGLVNRLGVRDSLKEPQLLRSQRPTPPSIVKKNANTVNLAVCANEKKEDNTQKSCEKLSTENSLQTSPKTSRQPSVSPNVHTSDGKSVSIELPHITHARQRQNQKSNSVISVAKYLQVSSHSNPNPASQEDQEASDRNPGGSTHSIADANLSSGFSSESMSELIDKSESSLHGADEANFLPKSARASLQDQLPLLDEAQKEKMIARKAQALGLISRDWVKTPHIKRMIGNYIWEDLQESEKYRCSYSRQTSRETVHLRRSCMESQSRESTRVMQQRRGQKRETPSSSSKILRHQSIDTAKLEKLKSIYEPSGSHERKKRESSSRGHLTRNHRCESRAASRPATRITTRGTEKQDCRAGQLEGGARSRPATRASKRFRNVGGDRLVAQLPNAVVKEIADEEDCYWNEISTNKDTRKLSKRKQDSESRDISRCVTRSSSRQHHNSIRNNHFLSRPVTRETGILHTHKDINQHCHSLAIAVRLRKPPQVRRTGTDIRALSPGAGPDQISAHATRMRRRFEGVLDIHHPKAVST